jgi:predicted  nucleic acid-binding Zn-ribbon protein
MPPGKRRQSNAMLYTLVTFVALFVVATTVAVIYYVKAEDLRTKSAEADKKLKDIASSDEQRRVGDIVGEKAQGQSSYLGSMAEYMDQVVGTIIGKPVPATTAQVKATRDIPRIISPLLARAQPYISLSPAKPAADANAADPNKSTAAAAEPNQVPLARVIDSLLIALKTVSDANDAGQRALKALRAQFNSETEAWGKARESLKADVDKYRQEVEKAKSDYAALQGQLSQKTTEQMTNIDQKLKSEQARTQQLSDELEKTKSELALAQDRLKTKQDEIEKIQPSPDTMAAAQKPDGKILGVSQAAGTVLINLGSQDRVYPGLTFSVYDRFAGISKNGKSKAEVEVFAINDKVCTARVLTSESRNPISPDDVVANLIWDSHKQNQFVIAGDFDLNGNGKPEPDAISKIKSLIEKWGGAVSNAVSAKTDFVILGDAPDVPSQPSDADLQADPTLRDKYNAAKQRLDQYNEIRQQAAAFYIPVLNYQRFLYFSGYKTESTRPGAF